ncbi:NirD/YgiW/YdeI family stress tolerance protein [Oxalobacter vibrioformis]|uniref:NirD/YgiW/YdeI family stress tolerance protein n=1 Tax=Oxalobacter vibrioformis TaxID=933080 RepID=A0A9E9LWE1_9BURK|nr:NirD/YgiW/YdeI family stress tolerance protein [Oxalobacter vibrioformis]WAW09917.1 NirD/YgiW/YdeI family stress tolerance protein [Oxalobacter vibrioformis]
MFNSRLGMILMVCAGIFVGITNYSYAQYSGPGSSSSSSKTSSKDRLKEVLGIEKSSSKDVVTIKELRIDPVYNEDVTVKGKLVKKTGSKVYRFEDGTGTMSVTIEDSLFKNKEVSESTTLEITGRVQKTKKKLFKEMEFKANSLKIVNS